jgi:hypothetical protein
MSVDSFPPPVERVVATLAELLRRQGERELADLVTAARSSIAQTSHDNWNGGTDYYTLFLRLPIATFAEVEPRLDEVQNKIAAKLRSVVKADQQDTEVLGSVDVSAILEPPMTGVRRAAPASEAQRLWQSGRLRLFLSHVSQHKVEVFELKRALGDLGVSAFVAHEDIEPTAEWQAEIELAIASMHAMAALLTPEFHDSLWTDQEVGMAVARGVLVIPVRLGRNPYGFVAKHQGMRGDLGSPGKLASDMVHILVEHESTARSMREGLVVAFEAARSFAMAKAVSLLIEGTHGFSPDQLARMEAAIEQNSQVAASFGVPERIRVAIAGHAQLPREGTGQRQ